MGRSTWVATLTVSAVLAIGVLFSLPKVVVKNKAGQANRDVTKNDSTVATKPAEAPHTDAENHNTVLSDAQKSTLSGLSSKLAKSTSTAAQIEVFEEYISFFSKNKLLDSAARYAEKIALLAPTERNMLIAGDRFYDAFGFASGNEKAQKMADKTREWYQKVLDKNPNLLIAKANMAMTYTISDNPMQGIMMLREVIATDPTNEVALFNLGLLSMRSNQFQKAVDRFLQVLKNNPKNTKARFYLGVSLAQIGKTKEALEALAVVKKQEPDPAIQQAVAELEKELK